MSKTDLFKEIIPAILYTKAEDIDFDYYKAFIVNKALSVHMDTVLYANEMNVHHDLPVNMQFHYLLNTVRRHKRPYQAWPKHETDEDLEMVKEHFNLSAEKAKLALRVLNEAHLEEIRKAMDKGGTNDKSSRPRRGKTKSS